MKDVVEDELLGHFARLGSVGDSLEGAEVLLLSMVEAEGLGLVRLRGGVL